MLASGFSISTAVNWKVNVWILQWVAAVLWPRTHVSYSDWLLLLLLEWYWMLCCPLVLVLNCIWFWASCWAGKCRLCVIVCLLHYIVIYIWGLSMFFCSLPSTKRRPLVVFFSFLMLKFPRLLLVPQFFDFSFVGFMIIIFKICSPFFDFKGCSFLLVFLHYHKELALGLWTIWVQFEWTPISNLNADGNCLFWPEVNPVT